MANIGFTSSDPNSDARSGYRSHKVARKSVGSANSYWLQGSDVSYNGFTFPPTVRCKATVVPEYTKDRRSIKWHTIALDIECYITQYDVENFVPNTSFGDTIDPHMAEIRKRLMQPCQLLSFTLQGFGNIQVQGASPSGFTVAGDVAYDVNFGPNPQVMEWQPMGGGLAARIQWLVTTQIPACSSTNGLQGIADLWYEIGWQTGVGGWESRNVSGGIEIAATRQPSSGGIHASATINLSAYKQQYDLALGHVRRMFPMLPGMDREEDFKLSLNKKVLNFNFRDTEIRSPGAYPEGVLRITGTESLSAENMSFYSWDWGFSAQIEVPNSKKVSDIPNNKKIAFAAFGEIVKERLARTKAQVKQNEIENDSGSLLKSKSVVAIPMSLRVTNDLFGPSFSVDLNYSLTCPPDKLWKATGFFDAIRIPGMTWENWLKFLEKTGAMLRYYDPIPNADVIVDLCHPISSSQGTVPQEPAHSYKDVLYAPEAPPEESSWMRYENEMEYETKHNTVTGTVLSPSAREYRNDDRLNDSQILNSDRQSNMVVAPIPTGGKAFLPTFSTAAEPIGYITMRGRAVRIGYQINPPILVSIGGTPVVQVGTDIVKPSHRPSGFRKNGQTVPMYGLQWERRYALTGPPRRNWLSKGNADPGIYV